MSLPSNASAKLARARQHINDLNGKIAEYLQKNPFKIVRRFDPSTGKLTLSIKTEIPVPRDIPLVLGDAIHCLRSALDHVYWSIMEPLVARKQDIQFPIYTLQNKQSVLGRRHIKRAPKNVAIEIEKSEPHPNGKHGIYEINTLDVRDKHQLLILAGRTVTLNPAIISLAFPEIGQRFTGPGSIRFTGQGDDIFIATLGPMHTTARRGAFEDDLNFSIPIELVFAEPPFQNIEVVKKLINLTNSIEERCGAIWAANQ